MDDKIEEYYENFNYPSADKLLKLMKGDKLDITKKQIVDYLNKKEEVQIFKESKKSKLKMGFITAMAPNELWQIDIFYMMKYHKQNNEFKYILCCVDVFTRKAYAIPMKTKDILEVIKSIKLFFKQAYTTPYIITSDSDTTFLSKECQNLFLENDISHHTVPIGDHAGLGIVDRFARTLKTILHKRFIKYNTTNWIDVLASVIEKYNNTPHSSLGDLKPNDITLDNADNIADIVDINAMKRHNKSTFKNEFSNGDKVRIKLGGFHKKTEGQYSDDIYIVESTKGKSVVLNDGSIKKYDMLLKVHQDTPNEKKINVIKKDKKDFKQEQLLKKIDIKSDNIIIDRPKRDINKPSRFND